LRSEVISVAREPSDHVHGTARQTEHHAASRRDDWSEATVQEMTDHLDAIGPPWGNSKLLASWVEEGFWIAYEALHRLEADRA
jgi:hypothetical protein